MTNQALKSGKGEDKWKRFFKLMGDVIAIEENCPLCPDVSDQVSLRVEAAKLASSLKVIPLLEGMGSVLQNFTSSGKDDLYLLMLDSHKREVRYEGFPQADFEKATKAYSQQERASNSNNDVHVVLVAVKSINELKDAYPSFFLDSTKFINILRELFQSNRTSKA